MVKCSILNEVSMVKYFILNWVPNDRLDYTE